MVSRASLFAVASLVVLVIAIGIGVYSRKNDDKKQPTEVPPTEIPGVFSIGEVLITNTDLTRILSSDEQTLPNCNGSSELTIRRSFRKATETKIEYQTSNTIRSEISSRIPFADLGASITSAITDMTGRTEGESIEEAIEVEMAAAPGTAVKYQIVWMEVFTAGVVEIIEKKGEEENHYFQEFVITSTLRAEPSEPERKSCESD